MATFEEQLTALEGVVERLEKGELPLDESVRLFEEGLRLSNACKQELDAAEGKIQVLVEGKSGKMVAVAMVDEDRADGADGDDEDE